MEYQGLLHNFWLFLYTLWPPQKYGPFSKHENMQNFKEGLTSLLFCVHLACLKIILFVYFFYKYHVNKPFNINFEVLF